MPLQEQIDQARANIKTDGYAMSIGEWMNLYASKELDIHPEFQRFFRWDDYQKSRFIESLLLGIPIPPVFVSQRKDGVWDVVDGLQRLSTIFQFSGQLLMEDGAASPALVLTATKYLPDLAGKKWEDEEHPELALTPAQRMLIKRTKISASIILSESDEKSKYELFQRLNTGGSELSPQEVRNCLLVMVNRDFFQWFRNLADDEAFIETTQLTDRALSERYDLELILRFLVFRRISPDVLVNIGDVGQFITDQMLLLAENKEFDYAKEEEAFRYVFGHLRSELGSNVFQRYLPNFDRFTGGFSVSTFEVLAMGLGYNFPNMPSGDDLRSRVKAIWQTPEMQQHAGSGVRASTRIPKTVVLGREMMK